MTRYEIEGEDGCEYVDAVSFEDAIENYTRDHAESQGWSDNVVLSIRTGKGRVRRYDVEWRMEMVVEVRKKL